jgi:hypothetical protein
MKFKTGGGSSCPDALSMYNMIYLVLSGFSKTAVELQLAFLKLPAATVFLPAFLKLLENHK